MASFYDSASIITIPSGYKAGTLYSAKPTDGAGDMSFTRTGDTATRVNSAGIIERCITNLALQSNNFSNASWTKSNVDIGTGITDPLGGTTAFSMAGNTSTSNTKSISQTAFSSSNDVKIISIYAKANTHSILQLRLTTSTVYANFDLSNGTFSTGSSGVASIQNIGGGWYRCSLYHTTTNTGIGYVLVDSLSSLQNEFTTTTNSVYIWRAQAQIGDQATNYIPTTTAAVTEGPVTNLPRLDYFNSTCPQLLMEPTRTNLLLYSQFFDASAWTKSNMSVSANTTISLDGYQNADTLTPSTSNSQHYINRNATVVSGTVYSFSVFAKANGYNFIYLYYQPTQASYFNLSTGQTIPAGSTIAKMENYGNGWYRCSIVFTAVGTSAPNEIHVLPSNASLTFTGDGTSGAHLWGAQLEAGAYATSYILTTLATVTRNQDLATKGSISSLIGQVEGTIFIDINYNQGTSDGNGRLLQLRDSSENSNAILPMIFPNRQFQLTIGSGGSGTNVIPASSSTLIPLGRNKLAIAYNDGSYVVYRNGSLFATATGVKPLATLTNIDLGNSAINTRNLGNPINQALVFKTRLTNDELATLTTL